MVSPADIPEAERSQLIRSFAGHETFCRTSLRLRERDGSLVPLNFWPSQRKLTAAIRKQQKRGRPVRILVLKTRRSGFTVGSCSHLFRELAFFEGRRGMVIADNYKPAAVEAFGYFKSFFSNYAPFRASGPSLKIRDYSLSEADLAVTGQSDGESIIDVYSADRGEIRGGGRHWALFDEVAFWRAAELTLRSAMVMIPDLAETGIIVQSTANGVGGEFYELWEKASDPLYDGGFECLFFGWLEDDNNRLSVSAEEISAIQRSLDSEEHHLHTMLNATIPQLAWRRWKIKTTFNGRVDDFHQEYPTTPREAFLTTGRPALDHAALARMPVGQGFSGEVELVEVPPRKRVMFVARDHGAVTIWSQPVPGRTYVIGADPSKGVDVSESKRGSNPDYSVGFVIDRESGVQVAMLRERLRPVAFAEYLALLGRLYNDAYIVPEANDAGFIDALIRTGYPLEYIYARGRMPDDLRPPTPGQVGFETTEVTRPMLVSALDDAIRQMALTIRSPVALQECRTFVIKPNGKREHQSGYHDDCVLAAAFAVIGLRSAPVRKTSTHGIRRYGKARAAEEE